MKNHPVFNKRKESIENNFSEIPLENPDVIMQSTLHQINDAFEFIYEQYSTSFDDFKKYVQLDKKLHRKIYQLWDNIDTDIYAHYEHGTLLSFELLNWKQDVIQWKENMFKALHDFIQDEFNDYFDPDNICLNFDEAA